MAEVKVANALIQHNIHVPLAFTDHLSPLLNSVSLTVKAPNRMLLPVQRQPASLTEHWHHTSNQL